MASGRMVFARCHRRGHAGRLAPELGTNRLAHPNAAPVLHSGLGCRRPDIGPSWRQQSGLSTFLSELRLTKERLLATASIHSLLIQITKIAAYASEYSAA